MGRESSGIGGTGREGGTPLDPANILDTQDLVTQRGAKETEVDQVLTTAKDMWDEYGQYGLAKDLQTADIGGKDGSMVMAYYDGDNVAVNNHFFNSSKMDAAYDASGDYHPSRGNKSAMEAVVAHEYGHAITDLAAKKMGARDLNAAATRIVNEARKTTKDKGVVQMARKISRYATASNAEAVAEAVADVYCNGKNAKAQSHAIVDVLNGYVKGR